MALTQSNYPSVSCRRTRFLLGRSAATCVACCIKGAPTEFQTCGPLRRTLGLGDKVPLRHPRSGGLPSVSQMQDALRALTGLESFTSRCTETARQEIQAVIKSGIVRKRLRSSQGTDSDALGGPAALNPNPGKANPGKFGQVMRLMHLRGQEGHGVDDDMAAAVAASKEGVEAQEEALRTKVAVEQALLRNGFQSNDVRGDGSCQ